MTVRRLRPRRAAAMPRLPPDFSRMDRPTDNGLAATLRPARPEDREKLWALDQACFDAQVAYTRDELEAYLDAPGAFALVLETEPGSPAAFVLASVGRRGQGHIVTLDVLPAFRRRGWGRRLLLAAEQRLRAAGCHQVRLEAAVNNAAALALYGRLGYRVRRVLRGYYHGGLDALSLAKLFSGGDGGP